MNKARLQPWKLLSAESERPGVILLIVGNIVCGSFGSGFVFLYILCFKKTEFYNTRILPCSQLKKRDASSAVFDSYFHLISSDYCVYLRFYFEGWQACILKIPKCNLLDSNGFAMLNCKTARIFYALAFWILHCDIQTRCLQIASRSRHERQICVK